jgi:hypothetical protein
MAVKSLSPGATIDSDFALLDVKKGRAALSKALTKLPQGQRVKVVITGYFDNDLRGHGNDDGTSREFCIDVESVEVAP